MDKVLLCTYNPFDLNQTIYYLNNNRPDQPISAVGSCASDNLSIMLVELYNANNCSAIHLMGPESLLEGVIKGIDEYSNLAYTKGTIKIELN